MTANEHQWEISRERRYLEIASSEADLRAFLAACVWALEEGPRALFDRAVLWLVEHRVLLPRITVLARLVAEVRSVEHERLHRLLADAPPPEQRRRLEELLVVPDDSRRSRLDQLRGGRVNLSGRGFQGALERAFEIKDLGAPRGRVAGRAASESRRACPVWVEREGHGITGAESEAARSDAACDRASARGRCCRRRA